MSKSAAEKKRAQRRRWKREGWCELRVRVAQEHADTVRAFVASLSPPQTAPHPGQQDLPIFGGSGDD